MFTHNHNQQNIATTHNITKIKESNKEIKNNNFSDKVETFWRTLQN